MNNKIIIAGGNGFLAQALVKSPIFKDYAFVLLVRKPIEVPNNCTLAIWDGKHQGAWSKEIDGALAVINFAGKSVNCRYTDKNKALIYSSRIESTKALAKAIAEAYSKPEVWLNASSATVYKHSEDKLMTEREGEYGPDFSPDVVLTWEKAFFETPIENVRKIAMRMSLVLGQEDGVLPVYQNLVKRGLGGTQGPGTQKVSWIHLQDVERAIHFFLQQKQLKGIYNVTAPTHVNNKEFMHLLRTRLNRKMGLPATRSLLKMGAVFMGTEAELILKSRFVYPARMLEDGFEFKFPTMSLALENLIPKQKK